MDCTAVPVNARLSSKGSLDVVQLEKNLDRGEGGGGTKGAYEPLAALAPEGRWADEDDCRRPAGLGGQDHGLQLFEVVAGECSNGPAQLTRLAQYAGESRLVHRRLLMPGASPELFSHGCGVGYLTKI
jgi:hypothetical protein